MQPEASMSRAFKCYAYQNGRHWSAICTDLDLAVDGKSFEETQEALTACIELYLDGLDGLPPDEKRHFLTRKAPLHVRARLAILTTLAGGIRNRAARLRQFTLRPHAPLLS